MRTAVIARDGRICGMCGRPVVRRSARSGRDRTPGNQLTLDHIVPVSLGGANDVNNLRVCCRACNMTKSSRG